MNKIKTLFLVGAMALTLTSCFTLTVGSGGRGAEIPRLVVEQSVKSVESSIGSINYLLKSKNEINNE